MVRDSDKIALPESSSSRSIPTQEPEETGFAGTWLDARQILAGPDYILHAPGTDPLVADDQAAPSTGSAHQN